MIALQINMVTIPRLLSIGTNSLMYEINTEYIYQGFRKDKEMYSFSNVCPKSKYYDDSNKLVAGKMKDEKGGVPIKERVSFKPKICTFLVEDSSNIKKQRV